MMSSGFILIFLIFNFHSLLMEHIQFLLANCSIVKQLVVWLSFCRFVTSVPDSELWWSDVNSTRPTRFWNTSNLIIHFSSTKIDTGNFYRAMLHVQSTVMLQYVVCLPVCMSVCDVQRFRYKTCCGLARDILTCQESLPSRCRVANKSGTSCNKLATWQLPLFRLGSYGETCLMDFGHSTSC